MSKAEELSQQKVEELASAVAEALGPAEGPPGAEFLRRYYTTVAPEDVLRPTRRHLIGAALSLWKLGESRAPGEVVLRVVNPRPESEGWQSPHTVVEIVNDDMPFLISSVTGALNRRNLNLYLVAYPTIPVIRTADGRRTGIAPGESAAPGTLAESYMHVELDQLTGAEEIEELRQRLLDVLADVRRAVDDWQPMIDRLRETTAELETHPPEMAEDRRREGLEFLRWLEGRFTFLGYREYDLAEEDGETFLRLDPESGLGVLSQTRKASLERSRRPLTPAAAANVRRREPLFITKTYNRSNVHRPVHMDYIGVRRFGPGGEVVGERRFIGLFTAAVYDDSIGHIPLLRDKVARVTARAGFDPTGHNSRSLGHVFESLPRDELFQVTDEELYELALGVMRLQERQRLALFVRQDPFERFVSCLVYVPRDHFNTRLRRRMEEILSDAFAGPVRAFDVRIGDSPLARVHFVLRTRLGAVPAFDVHEIEARLADAARSWGDRLREALIEVHGEGEGLELYRRYETDLLAAYREHFEPRVAVDDIGRVEEVAATGELQMRLYRSPGAPPERVNFKIYSAQLRLLSGVLPMFESMGFEVISEVPYEVRATDRGTCYWLLDFELITADRAPVDLAATYERFQDAFARVWNGEVENDGFNRLVLTAGLTWREVVVLRAYARYLRQTGIAFSQAYIEDTLARNPEPARLLYELFVARFDPDRCAETPARIAALQAQVRAALTAVSSLDEDRILRRYLNLIDCTLRTNFFQRDESGDPPSYVAFKFDAPQIERLPDPRPIYEVWIYSPRVEAVHLRGGKVARGGIRWSDRPEDFRTEILGLMKAQMVKNAVIVPVGAKGGFIVKRPPAGGREARQTEGVECYKIMMRGLLDITDNLVGGQVVTPPRVVRHDDDDPYLVVAADKGTAAFSDIANSVAAEYGFWMGDAFASGGSAGYDHKQMGITARGAWESVKRHFRELGHDIQSQPFTVVGVGDMSGDVFGNGMLLSRHTRLVGAFNHLHVFVDPDPDPAAGFAERQRLFDGRLGWNEYAPAVLSPGGAVYERSAKEIELSPEVRRRLGVETETVTPDELIRALLSAPVDLLWMGGIGTYVKASEESHADVGDRINNETRVDAAALRCKVVGEGANLGFTQRARIEYALGGGRINSDFVDNSGGVNTADYEVNLKICLSEAIAAGEISAADRDHLINLTPEITERVLYDSYLNAQAISLEESSSVAILVDQSRLISFLERRGILSRWLERLPHDEDFAHRTENGAGLTRPEIAILQAYSKIWLSDEIAVSDLPKEALPTRELERYFPAVVPQKITEGLHRHPLRHQIVARRLANDVVQRTGSTFVFRLAERQKCQARQVVSSYLIVRAAFGLEHIWGAIEELDGRVPAAVQLALMREVASLLEKAVMQLLGGPRSSSEMSANDLRPLISVLEERLEDLLPPQRLDKYQVRVRGYSALAVPEQIARRISGLELLADTLDAVHLAKSLDQQPSEVLRIHLDLGERFGFDPLQLAAEQAGPASEGEQAILEQLWGDLVELHRRLTAAVVLEKGIGVDAVQLWLAARGIAEPSGSISPEPFLNTEASLAVLLEGHERLDSQLESLIRASADSL